MEKMTSTLLYAPMEYWELSPAAHKEICDGCGPNLLAAFIPDTLLGLNITDACNIHDYMYAVGEHENDRRTADRVLLNNLIRIIESDSASWLKPARKIAALTYYYIVRSFGAPFFGKGKNLPEEFRCPDDFFEEDFD